MPTLLILRPIFISTVVWAGIFVIAAQLFGGEVALRALLIGFSLSNIAVFSVLALTALVAEKFKPAVLIRSVVWAVSFWFLIRFGLPFSYLILINGLNPSSDLTWTGFRKSIDGLSSAGDPVERIGVALAVLICAMFVDRTMTAIGFPGARVHTKRYWRALTFRRLSLAALSAVGIGISILVPVAIVGVTALIVVLALFVFISIYFLSWRFALDVYRTAAVATPLAWTDGVTKPWAYHATDIHLTAPGVARAEGGEGGLPRLEALARTVAERRTGIVLLTGDITDHADDREWKAARDILKPLADADCRVLLAPGNHDLSSAYDPGIQFYSRLAEHGFGQERQYEYLYGRRLLDYVRIQNELCPGIVVASGEALSTWVRVNLGLLDAERDFYRRVGADGRLDEPALAAYVDDVIARGLLVSHLGPGYATLLRRNAAEHLAGYDDKRWQITEGFAGLSAADRIFPMRYSDAAHDAEIFMLNSVVADDSLFASASGELPQDQAKRFSDMIAGCTARNLGVLIHHAPFRWADEPRPKLGNQVRWNSLAMDNSSAELFMEPLAAAVGQGKQVIFCCGHRHGGHDRKTMLGTLDGVLVLEGASLAESDTAVSIIGLTPQGFLAMPAVPESPNPAA